MSSLLLPFLLACFALCFSHLFLPTVHLFAFAPFFALLFLRKSFLFSIWTAVLCGLLMDLLNSKFHFGFCALNSCLTCLLVYSQKRNFFEDRLFSLACYTALISVVSSFIELGFLTLFEKQFPLKWPLVITDLMLMPAFDALYGFLWFSCPIKLYQNLRKPKIR
ncbi:MAG TPA: rod shape-determining protein MreD [Rhabdochlamydiaceae bacterium]|nr:rod shape-determining protein MreD [Rhabdochlamydiaceae bacterium]